MTAATGDMVDDKDEAMKPELQLDVDLDIRGLDIRDLDFSGLDLDKADSGVLNAIERRDAILGQRLATAVYLTSGGLAVVHMATFGVVMTLAG